MADLFDAHISEDGLRRQSGGISSAFGALA